VWQQEVQRRYQREEDQAELGAIEKHASAQMNQNGAW